METTIMENQMEKKMENEMETGIILVLHGFPYDSLYTTPFLGSPEIRVIKG